MAKLYNFGISQDIIEIIESTSRIFKSQRHGNKPREEQNDGKFKE